MESANVYKEKMTITLCAIVTLTIFNRWLDFYWYTTKNGEAGVPPAAVQEEMRLGPQQDASTSSVLYGVHKAQGTLTFS